MQHGARLFAYTTWVVMISLAIIIFTNPFLSYVSDPGWIGLLALLGFGFLYLNFSYLAIKRYVRKVPVETRLHFLLAAIIFLPPAIWIAFFTEGIENSVFILLFVLVFACFLGAIYGYRSGKRQQYEYFEASQEKSD